MWLGAAGVVFLVWAGHFVWEYFDPGGTAHQTIQLQLKLFGSAIYEYHSVTGRWPSKLDDLAETSLPRKSYVWRETAKSFVILWPQELKADLKENARVVLVYDDGSLFSGHGRVWVCWGDLRTEMLDRKDLLARLGRGAGRE